MNSSKQILMCQIEDKKATQIRELCAKLGYQTKTISPGEYSQSLGFLAGIRGIPRLGQDDSDQYSKSPLVTRPSQMLVFSGFTEEELDEFLDDYRNAGIAPIPLKAILTPINVFWSVQKLCRELVSEHLFYQ